VAGASLTIWFMEKSFQKKYERLYQELTLVLSEVASDKGSGGTAFGRKLCKEFFSSQPYAKAWEKCLKLSLVSENELPPLATPAQITDEIFNLILDPSFEKEGGKGDGHQVS